MSDVRDSSPLPRKRSNAWIWFFTFVFVASVVLAGFMIWFNMRLQLKPEQLEAAMQRWKEHGPRDYRLVVTKQVNENEPDHFDITVRDRRVIDVRLNGQRLRNEANEPYPPGHERLQWYTMHHLLREIEVLLDQDAKAGKKNYNVAHFDDQTGALRKYIRRVMGSRQRVEETVKLEPLAPE
jgi:hypothetical protein